MANFFDNASKDTKSLEQKLLGPDYKYYKYINSPEDMGMSSNGSIDAITKDIAGLINYVTLLSAGGGPASKTGEPLGNKFFLETGAKCKDKASGETVVRSLYINNVPDGSIPFITSGMGVRTNNLNGLIPGTLSNLSQINPMQMFGAFMEGTNPECQSITMETISANNEKKYEKAFVTTNDIKSMNPKWFPNNKNPTTTQEGFSMGNGDYVYGDSSEYKKYVNTYNKKYNIINKKKQNTTDYSIMPNDVFVKLYYSSLSLLLLYIFTKLFQERK